MMMTEKKMTTTYDHAKITERNFFVYTPKITHFRMCMNTKLVLVFEYDEDDEEDEGPEDDGNFFADIFGWTAKASIKIINPSFFGTHQNRVLFMGIIWWG